MMTLQYYPLHADVHGPLYATEDADCFDFKAFLKEGTEVKCFSSENSLHTVKVGADKALQLRPFYRALIPTGMILDIPIGCAVHVYPRSGNAIKKGLTLVNSVGVIDHDYVDELMILVVNLSRTIVPVFHNDRVAQGRVVVSMQQDIKVADCPPVRYSNRTGGMGSTGE